MARYDWVIPPGGEGKIILKINTKRYEGNINRSARVYTNDPKNKVVKIGVTAFVKVPISISRKLVYLGGFAGSITEKVVTIKAHNPTPLTLKPVSFSISDKVDYKMETLEKGRCFRIVFRNKCAAEERYNGYLKLRTNYPDKPIIAIRVIGNIRTKRLRPQGTEGGS